ncbi:MAG TPA: insulinase family protein, partial [Geoalkalibacter subterraneus]|nr:insulinase family protein [Geoalkalibacter subterraneus]
FKGTRRRDALGIAREIDSVGGILNAFTSREFSCYYAKVLGNHLDVAVDLLSDILLNSVFDIDELEKERKVILQEIFMIEDAPDEQIHDLCCEHLWPGHPLGRPIIGSRQSVAELDRARMLSFMNDRYRGRNIVVCAAGQVDHDRLVDQIERALAGIPAGEELAKGPAPKSVRGIYHQGKDLEQLHLCLGTPSLPQNHPDRFQAHLINVVLGGSMSSRLFQRVREDAGLAYSIYSYLNSHSDSGALVVYAGVSPDDLREVVSLILQELDDLRTNPLSERELRAAKEQLKGHLLLSLESSDNRMTRLARNEIYLRRDVDVDEVVGAIEAVNAADLQNIARHLFQEDSLILETLGQCRDQDLTMLDLALS